MDVSQLKGKRVRVHFNLHKKLWTVMYGGKIVDHVNYITLRPTKFHVNENGRQRVIKNKRKEVHAWVWGVVCDINEQRSVVSDVSVSYDPYKYPHFYKFVPDHEASMASECEFTALFFDYISRRAHAVDSIDEEGCNE